MSTADGDSPRPAGTPVAPTPSDTRGEPQPRPSAGDIEAAHANPRGCPFLVADAGGWRLDTASRNHRCGAFSPAAPLAPEKQSRLCLTPGHTSCATYVASLSARTERVGVAPVRRTTRWGLARTTSVIEDAGGLRGRLLAAVLDRRRWPAIPAVILVTALFVLALSGFRAGVPTGPVATASAAAVASARATRPATTSPSEAPATTEPTPAATPAKTARPEKTPRPSASFRTYAVRSGDTLGEIANRFGTTVSALADLNNLADPGRLRIGQVLLIP